ncbi:MAG: hypothetical protein ABR971_03215 [Acidobacteriaceae bacterium]
MKGLSQFQRRWLKILTVAYLPEYRLQKVSYREVGQYPRISWSGQDNRPLRHLSGLILVCLGTSAIQAWPWF